MIGAVHSARMSASASGWRCPAWLRAAGWVAFSLWLLAAALVVARWWLMSSAHHRTQSIQQTTPPRLPTMPKASDIEQLAPPAEGASEQSSHGTPVAEVPFFKDLLLDENEGRDLHAVLEELAQWRIHMGASRDGGTLSFRTLLKLLGGKVPDTMSEAEAAAEFLKLADRFSGMLAGWREALEMGPWDFSSVHRPYRDNIEDNLAMEFRNLLGAITEAHWRLGQSDEAWASFRLMHASTDDIAPYRAYFGLQMAHDRGQASWYQTYRAGLTLGAFTDIQLAEVPALLATQNMFATAQRKLEAEKNRLVEDYDRRTKLAERSELRGVQTLFPRNLHTMSVNFVNDIEARFVTSQQLADNLALLHHTIDHSLSGFDASNGHLLPSAAGLANPPAAGVPAESWFEQRYFQFAEWDNIALYPRVAEWVVDSQTTIDHMRLAAAIELHQRATGRYPDSLDAVRGHLPSGLPQDPATGQGYGYRRLPEGGYQLWGNGIDQVDDGGTPDKDVVWIFPQ